MKKILFSTTILVLFSLSCKKENDPAPLTKQDVIDIVNSDTTKNLTRQDIIDIVNQEFINGDSIGQNTVTFTVTGKRSDSVAYSYTKTFHQIIDSSYFQHFIGESSYFYFYQEGDYDDANVLSFSLLGINTSNVNVNDIELTSSDINLDVTQQITPTSFHSFDSHYLPFAASSTSTISNLSFNSSTRILTGNFNIPKRHASYEYDQNLQKYVGKGSTLQVLNGTFSIYIPNVTIIGRKEK